MKALSIAHDAIMNYAYRKDVKVSQRYESQSPDEITLLNFASDCGYKLIKCEQNERIVENTEEIFGLPSNTRSFSIHGNQRDL